MTRTIKFEGVSHSFPDDATDEEISAALEGQTAVGDLTPGGKIQKGSLGPEDRLALVKAQLSDPERNQVFDSELQRELKMLTANVPNPGAVAPNAGTPPRPSQADVRASEPPHTLAAQDADEKGFNAALNAWLKTQTGQYHAGPNAREQFSKITGRPDPLLNRDKAEVQHAAETGDVVYGTGTTYQVAKPLAGIAGFAVGGPGGSTAAEGAVRFAALANNLDNAVKAGAITTDRAAEILGTEMAKGSAEDAAWNFGVPIVGQLAKKLPGATWITEKVGDAVEAAMKRMGRTPAAPAQTLREAKIQKRAGLTDDPARKAAVDELHARVEGDNLLTPGQVRGDAGLTETAVNKTFHVPFEEQEKAFGKAADDMLRETTTPGVQPSAQGLGEQIQTAADATQEAVKKRLRPAFEAADKLGVKVDMTEVKGLIRKALLEDSRVPGGKLQPVERAQLETILDDINKNPKIGASQALDFISRRKEQLRASTADWKPSKEYDKIVGALTTATDEAYVRGAGTAKGGSDVVKKLLDAQRDYKEMMGTVYDDAIKAALKKNPEDVGRFLWQGGNVSEPQQLQKMLKIAQRERAMTPQQAEEMSKSIARGFMQEAVPNIEAAAKWSTTLKENPAKRRTWEELTSAPGGKELRSAMEVLEQAAQMATMRDTTKRIPVPVGRAAGLGLGVSYVTGAIHPGMLVGGLGIAGMMKMMATAYTHGDKGAINLAAKVLRLRGVGTPAATQALKGLLPGLEQAAAQYGVEDIFEPKEEQQ